MKTTYIIDTSYLLHVFYFANKPKQENYAEDNINFHIAPFIQMLEFLLLREDTKAVIFCLDSKITKIKEEFKEYKANRDRPYKRIIYNNIEKIISAFTMLPRVYYAKEKEYEADDIIYSLAMSIDNSYDRSVIISSDFDIAQVLIRDNIFVCRGFDFSDISKLHDPIEFTKFWDKEIMIKEKGIKPESIPLYKVFRGDKSDNIKPIVPRFYEKLAIEIANKAGTNIDALYDGVLDSIYKKSNADKKTKKYIKFIHYIYNNRETVEKRFKLFMLSKINIKINSEEQYNKELHSLISDYYMIKKFDRLLAIFDIRERS